jgi:hypothetical protein
MQCDLFVKAELAGEFAARRLPRRMICRVVLADLAFGSTAGYRVLIKLLRFIAAPIVLPLPLDRGTVLWRCGVVLVPAWQGMSDAD